MSRLLAIYLEICTFKRGPQDLPASRGLLYLSMALYAGTIALYEVRQGTSWAGLPMIILGIVAAWALYSSLLRLNEKESRLTQTLSATFGCGVIINLAMAPIQWPWVDAMLAEADPPPGFGLLLFVMVIWSLVIEGHIIRNAIETTLARGVLIALAFTMITIFALQVVRASMP